MIMMATKSVFLSSVVLQPRWGKKEERGKTKCGPGWIELLMFGRAYSYVYIVTKYEASKKSLTSRVHVIPSSPNFDYYSMKEDEFSTPSVAAVHSHVQSLFLTMNTNATFNLNTVLVQKQQQDQLYSYSSSRTLL